MRFEPLYSSITQHILELIRGKTKFQLKMAAVNHKTSLFYVKGFKHEKLNDEKNISAFTSTLDKWK